jgi:SAM-dependent MidA family methyltransferase
MAKKRIKILPAASVGLPAPTLAAKAASLALADRMVAEMSASEMNAIPFSRYMQLALYDPQGGYYAGGGELQGALLGEGGDFTTAPQLSPYFARTVARQIAQVLIAGGFSQVLEFGAGSGVLAQGVLRALSEHGLKPRYQILEVSGALRERQQALLAEFAEQVSWLDALPEHFEGVMLGNEVLDAMPVELVERSFYEPEGFVRLYVGLNDHAFVLQLTEEIMPMPEEAKAIEPPYRTELGLQAQGFIRSVAASLKRGVALFLDYGFPAHEYYHPQRYSGTLMCHYRRQAHADPMVLPGLQDITSHIDFTAIALTAQDAGLKVLGYTSQARFLLNNGILELLPDAEDRMARLTATQQVQMLTGEHEMGELFKVIALGTEDFELAGFSAGDRTHKL